MIHVFSHTTKNNFNHRNGFNFPIQINSTIQTRTDKIILSAENYLPYPFLSPETLPKSHFVVASGLQPEILKYSGGGDVTVIEVPSLHERWRYERHQKRLLRVGLVMGQCVELSISMFCFCLLVDY